jgi:hypothetical protein
MKRQPSLLRATPDPLPEDDVLHAEGGGVGLVVGDLLAVRGVAA